MNLKFLSAAVLFALVVGCDDDEKLSSIEGKWQGTKAEGKVLIYGVPTGFEETDDTFSPLLEFKQGGVVVLTQDGPPTQGTWSQDGEKLTTSLNLATDFVDLSGTYTIQTLTDTKLVLYFEKDGTYEDPDTQIDIDGTLKVTLSFDRK